MRDNTFQLLKNKKTYNIFYDNKRVKNPKIKINYEGKIIVTGNNLSEKTILDMVNKYSGWIDKITFKINSRIDELDYNKYLKGEIVWIFGEKYDVKAGDEFNIYPNNVIITHNNSLLKISSEIKSFYSYYLLERCNYYSDIFKIYPKVILKDLKSKHGYCLYKKNTIVLSKRLLHFSKDIIDYVIIHEFCHFSVPNHSKDFYTLVSKYMPNYKVILKKINKMSYLCKY